MIDNNDYYIKDLLLIVLNAAINSKNPAVSSTVPACGENVLILVL